MAHARDVISLSREDHVYCDASRQVISLHCCHSKCDMGAVGGVRALAERMSRLEREGEGEGGRILQLSSHTGLIQGGRERERERDYICSSQSG